MIRQARIGLFGARALVLTLCAGGWLASGARAQWLPPHWSIARLGLVDAEHTRADGFQASAPPSGAATAGLWSIGASTRYVNGTEGRSAWAWSRGGGVVRLGLLDGEHTSAAGKQGSEATGLSASGRVIGHSERFAGLLDAGTTAWTWTPSAGHETLGYTDATHTRADGRRASRALALTPGGLIAGESDRYCASAGAGVTAWVWREGAALTRVGLFDAEHTSPGGCAGVQASRIVRASADGVVVGRSERSSGGVGQVGYSAWVWRESAGTVAIGLTDDEHTGGGFGQSVLSYNQPTGVGPGGMAFGSARRFDENNAHAGLSAWVWREGLGVARVGFTDAEHSSGAGVVYKYSEVVGAAFGMAVGSSVRFLGNEFERGSTAWVWSAQGGLLALGYTDAVHTRMLDGRRFSVPVAINPSGAVIGYSDRYNLPGAADYSGRDAWAWDEAGGVRALSLIDAAHTRADGFRVSVPSMINGAGQVVGYAERYDGSIQRGQSAWFFDPATGVTASLDYPVGGAPPAPGDVAFTEAAILTERGEIVGVYKVFSAGQFVTKRLFVWSAADGFADLGELVEGGAVSHGWDPLVAPLGALERAPSASEPAGALAGVVGFAGYIAGGAQNEGVLAILAPCPGDANSDGVIDFLDLNIVLSDFGSTGPVGSIPGDLDRDGDCDFIDLNIVLGAFGGAC